MSETRIVNAEWIDGGTPPDYWERYAIWEKMTPRERGREGGRIFICHECRRCGLSGGPTFSAQCSNCGQPNAHVTLEEVKAKFPCFQQAN